MSKVRLRWLTNAAFEIQSCGQVIVVDPCLSLTPYKGFDENSFERVDQVLISHIHWDHISDLPQIYRKFMPNIFCGALSAETLIRWYHGNPSLMYPMYPDQEIDMGPFKVKMLYNRHLNINIEMGVDKPSKYTFWDDYPGMKQVSEMGSMEMCNYLLTFENGFRILIWGGNQGYDQIAKLRGLKPDLAIMQYSKQRADKLTELLDAIQPKVVLPHHHDLRKPFEDPAVQESLQVLRDTYKGTLLTPKNGEWLEF